MSAKDPESMIDTPAERVAATSPSHLRLNVPAKINLNLLVGRRRPDGYHPVDSYVSRITLYDELSLRRRREGIVLRCRGLNCGSDQDNLALRAAELITGHSPAAGQGVEIELIKHIAPGAGLGGGSSDAAAVLWGLNRLWRLDIDPVELAQLAANLGSDVPFFLTPSPAARLTGRGERIEPADIHPFWMLLCVPEVRCATTEVYRAFDSQPRDEYRQLDATELVASPSLWRSRLVNQLTPAAEVVQPALADIHRRLSSCTTSPVSLTGSGSAMFVLCDTSEEAYRLLERLDDHLRRCCVVVRDNPW